MPFTIRAATSNDAESILQIVSEAYPSTPAAAAAAADVQSLALAVMKEDLQNQPPDVFPEWVVAKDEISGAVISYMQLVYQTESWAEGRLQKLGSGSTTAGETSMLAAKRERQEKIRSLRLHAMAGKSHLFVKHLATRPAFQRQRAGSNLLELAIARASQLNVVLYLDSREDALGFYEKFDFQPINSVLVDSIDGGRQYRHVAMKRPPQ